ncbi:MAG: BrnA antitoxin family protein [Pseudomonadota bacterium]|nr:BrnA antitoxin family protein [Pseudomonadota bacterium]
MSKKPLIDKDGEVRDLTSDDFKKFKPLSEANPALYAKIKKGVGERGPQKSPTKIPISIRVSPEVAEYFRAKGKGWQGSIDNVLKEYVAHHK